MKNQGVVQHTLILTIRETIQKPRHSERSPVVLLNVEESSTSSKHLCGDLLRIPVARNIPNSDKFPNLAALVLSPFDFRSCL